MIWVFVLAFGIAITFSVLGALSVWLKLLSVGLKLALSALGILTFAFLWMHIFRKTRRAGGEGTGCLHT